MAAITHKHDCDVLRRNAASPTTLGGDFFDTYIDEDNPTINYNGSLIRAGVIDHGGKGNTTECRGLFYYDLNSFIPASATITDAEWWVYVYATTMIDQNHDFRMYRLTRTDWVENEATWNIYKTGSSWTTPGGDVATPYVWLDEVQWRTTGWKNVVPDPSAYIKTIVQDAWDNRSGILTFRLERASSLDVGGYVDLYGKERHSSDSAKPHHMRVTYTLAGKTFQAIVT